jgi:hypothetical protein
MGRRAIQDMLRVTFPESERTLDGLPVPVLI